MSPSPEGSGGGRIGLSTYLKPLEISRFSGGGGRCGGVFRLRVPWGAGAGARSIAGQSGSKSTASLARPHGQSDPVYTRQPMEHRLGWDRLFPRRRRAPFARQSRKGPSGPWEHVGSGGLGVVSWDEERAEAARPIGRLGDSMSAPR